MTKINWQAEVEKHQEKLMADLDHLLRINSVRDDEEVTADQPFGPGPKQALELFLAFGERDGFKTKMVENVAGDIRYGEGDESLGILCHVDVVPVDDKWDTDPFVPEIHDGKIFARGVSDDKGPSMAAYYGLKIVSEMDFEPSRQVRLIIGTDEESGWQCLKTYFKHEPQPTFGFAPDSDFPITNAEKGIYTINIDLAYQAGQADYQLHYFQAGQRANMVPAQARVEITGLNLEHLADAYEVYLEKHSQIQGNYELSNKYLSLDLTGKAAHGASPELGINAATYLADFLVSQDFAGSDKAFIEMIAKYFHEATDGAKLGLNVSDAYMGPLTMNLGVMTYNQEKGGSIAVNFRIPKGYGREEVDQAINEKLVAYPITTWSDEYKPAHYTPKDDPMVETLLEVYERQTGEEAYAKSIGGGTYSRLLDRGVAFGAQFPGYEDTMHQANEYMKVEDILKATAIYAESIYELIK